ncbi:2-nitropropane dioxygenase [Xylariaceae sp. FL0804]|nr:2-nitropropane dioxygenase [Xylariaceae sp. FL0804]
MLTGTEQQHEQEPGTGKAEKMSLAKKLPWTKSPLIISAPMGGGFAGAALAIAVTLAGGLGMIGSDVNMNALARELIIAEQQLLPVPVPVPEPGEAGDNDNDNEEGGERGVLPVGVGVLMFAAAAHIDDVMRLLSRYRPAVVWLSFPREMADFATWAERARAASPRSQIWAQVGSVAEALAVAATARPDVLCLQGGDAGGHGLERGAGVISLLPETVDALARQRRQQRQQERGHGGGEGGGDGDAAGAGAGAAAGAADDDDDGIALVAAGGIADGRGAAAALALGAQGVVLGTRFLAATETNIHPVFRAALVAADDGGQSTARARVFDELAGPSIWPAPYDGRALAAATWRDRVAGGVALDEVRRRLADAKTSDPDAAGYGVRGAGRAPMWAGTGVGLVRAEQRAGEVVQEVRGGAREALERARRVL